MDIVESYCEAKLSSDLIEDFMVADQDFISVVDGATDKTGHRVNGVFGGQFVARTIAEAMTKRAVIPDDSTFLEWVSVITNVVDRALSDAGWPSDLPRPCACCVTYSRFRREIWRVGDSNFRIDGVDHIGGKKIDDIISEHRAAMMLAALADGSTVVELLANDIGRQAILPMLRDQHRHANNPDSPLGYPVFDGRVIAPGLLEAPVAVPSGAFVVLTSDGFDFPKDTLKATIELQRLSYEADPLRIGLDGARPSTKGIHGLNRHDDQTYVSFYA